MRRGNDVSEVKESRTDRRRDGFCLHQVLIDLSSIFIVIHAVIQILLILHPLLTAAHTIKYRVLTLHCITLLFEFYCEWLFTPHDNHMKGSHKNTHSSGFYGSGFKYYTTNHVSQEQHLIHGCESGSDTHTHMHAKTLTPQACSDCSHLSQLLYLSSWASVTCLSACVFLSFLYMCLRTKSPREERNMRTDLSKRDLYRVHVKELDL